MLDIKQKLTNECWTGGNSKKYIVVHHTGSRTGTTYDNIIRFFTKWDYISVHYVIGLNGEVTQMVRENDRAWHAGRSEWKGDKNLNNSSIGIEVLSDGYVFTDKQRDTVQQLCREIMDRNKIVKSRVLRHEDIAPTRKWDIGMNFFKRRWGTWKAFQDSLVPQLDAKKIARLNKAYSVQADITSDELAKLNKIKKNLAIAKQVKFVPNTIN